MSYISKVLDGLNAVAESVLRLLKTVAGAIIVVGGLLVINSFELFPKLPLFQTEEDTDASVEKQAPPSFNAIGGLRFWSDTLEPFTPRPQTMLGLAVIYDEVGEHLQRFAIYAFFFMQIEDGIIIGERSVLPDGTEVPSRFGAPSKWADNLTNKRYRRENFSHLDKYGLKFFPSGSNPAQGIRYRTPADYDVDAIFLCSKNDNVEVLGQDPLVDMKGVCRGRAYFPDIGFGFSFRFPLDGMPSWRDNLLSVRALAVQHVEEQKSMQEQNQSEFQDDQGGYSLN